MLAGFGYSKISAAPFHMWTPDVYEGAPTPVTSVRRSRPQGRRLRGAAPLLRRRARRGARGARAPRAPSSSRPGPSSRAASPCATMTIGNLSALGQDNVKRMLAFSSISASQATCSSASRSSARAASPRSSSTSPSPPLLHEPRRLPRRDGGRGRRATATRPATAFRGLGRRAPMTAGTHGALPLLADGAPRPLRRLLPASSTISFAAVLKAGGPWSWTIAVVGVLNSVGSLLLLRARRAR